MAAAAIFKITKITLSPQRFDVNFKFLIFDNLIWQIANQIEKLL